MIVASWRWRIMEAHKVECRGPCSLVEEEDKDDQLRDCLAYLILVMEQVGCL